MDVVAGLAAILPMGTLLLGAFSAGCEGLTLNVLFCCASPLRLRPASTTATANENLIFNPLLLNFGLLNPLDARTLPFSAYISYMLNPPLRESTRENCKWANGLVGAAIRGNAGSNEQDGGHVQTSAH